MRTNVDPDEKEVDFEYEIEEIDDDTAYEIEALKEFGYYDN